MSTSSNELKPDKVKIYLKLLTEACVTLNANKGSLRKDIWDYLNKKYTSSIDYRDFLLAIRRFFLDGKLINNEGEYQMHPAVLDEVREKTPTPVFKKVGETASQAYLKFLKGIDIQDSTGGSAKRKDKLPPSSKISDSGKRNKTKQFKESVRQSKIQKYFLNKQKKNLDFKEFQKTQIDTSKRLGFATPAFDTQAFVYQDVVNDKLSPKKESAKRVGIQ